MEDNTPKTCNHNYFTKCALCTNTDCEVKWLESIVTSRLNKVFEYDKNQLPIV